MERISAIFGTLIASLPFTAKFNRSKSCWLSWVSRPLSRRGADVLLRA